MNEDAKRSILEMARGGITFVEADGGMWKLKARETVKAYLETQLHKEVQDGTVIIAL